MPQQPLENNQKSPKTGMSENKSLLKRLVMSPRAIGTGIIISIILIYIGLAIPMLINPDYPLDEAYRILAISGLIYNLGILSLVLIFLGLGIGRGDYPQGSEWHLSWVHSF